MADLTPLEEARRALKNAHKAAQEAKLKWQEAEAALILAHRAEVREQWRAEWFTKSERDEWER